jgi:hypothetical protein
MALTKMLLSAVILVVSDSPALAQTYSDPAPYCKAVGPIDKPDARYSGPKLPALLSKISPIWQAGSIGPAKHK